MADIVVREADPAEFSWSHGTGGAAALARISRESDVVDGGHSLNEDVLLQLKHRGLTGARLWLSSCVEATSKTADDVGVLLLHGTQVELVVAPRHRQSGHARQLITQALAASRADGTSLPNELLAWSHSAHPGAEALAASLGFADVRTLLVMSRGCDQPLPALAPPADITVRGFESDDEQGLIEVNARAFAQHPEQGSMTLENFRERTAESWFDPAGLLIASHDDQVLGFHWTKLPAGDTTGEVYVVAVSPKAAGRGLGKLLTVAGLKHLADAGAEQVQLYVEGDNDPALALYRSLGFTEIRSEVEYAGSPPR